MKLKFEPYKCSTVYIQAPEFNQNVKLISPICKKIELQLCVSQMLKLIQPPDGFNFLCMYMYVLVHVHH